MRFLGVFSVESDMCDDVGEVGDVGEAGEASSIEASDAMVSCKCVDLVAVLYPVSVAGARRRVVCLRQSFVGSSFHCPDW